MNPNQARKLDELAKSRDYGHGIKHAEQVKRLCGKICDELSRLGLFAASENDRAILESASLLHDISLPREPHNEAGFDLLAVEIPRVLASDPLTPEELSTILYCVLWHRGSRFETRGNIEIADWLYTRKMAAVLRVADALDRTLRQLVEHVKLNTEGCRLNFIVFSKYSIATEISKAKEKDDLMKQVFALTELRFEYAKS